MTKRQVGANPKLHGRGAVWPSGRGSRPDAPERARHSEQGWLLRSYRLGGGGRRRELPAYFTQHALGSRGPTGQQSAVKQKRLAAGIETPSEESRITGLCGHGEILARSSPGLDHKPLKEWFKVGPQTFDRGLRLDHKPLIVVSRLDHKPLKRVV
ncbi:hypothetical protein NL676_017742 [Syzygium grande]|nr:hypothetical protein NL676_017742 [Syzygium grande]